MLREKRKIDDKSDYDPNQKLFNTIPNDTIKNIFDNLSPIQLANASLVCHQFEDIAKSFPKLTNIQVAFFNSKTSILKQRLKVAFKKTLDQLKHVPDEGLDGGFYTFNFVRIKALIKNGAPINSTGVQFIQPLLFYYKKFLASGKFGTEIDSGNSTLVYLKKLILFLVEHKIDINEPYTSNGSIKQLSGMSAINYAKKFAVKCPVMVAILQEYDEFNQRPSANIVKKIT